MENPKSGLQEVKTVKDIRTILSETIVAIRNKSCTAAEGNSVARNVSALLTSIRLEMDYCQKTGQEITIPFLGGNERKAIEQQDKDKDK